VVKNFLYIVLLGLILDFIISPGVDSTNFLVSTLSTIFGGILISVVFYSIFFSTFEDTEKK